MSVCSPEQNENAMGLSLVAGPPKAYGAARQRLRYLDLAAPLILREIGFDFAPMGLNHSARWHADGDPAMGGTATMFRFFSATLPYSSTVP